MVAFRNELPLVQLQGGRVVPFEQDWLNHNLAAAAAKAGYPNWWLAEHVAQSVASYLKNECEEEVLAVRRLSKAVRSVLQVIGYSEVADHFEPSAPPMEIGLAQIASRAGSGYELLFFDLLAKQIGEMRELGISHFRFTGLRECVRRLGTTRAWSRRCAVLNDEIIHFLRQSLMCEPERGEVSFSVR